MEPSARVVADSISLQGYRVTTIEAVMHRFVLAELNTHRVFSRNSASSRAIPLSRQLARVGSDPAIPVSWPEEQKGMQGGEELSGHSAEEAIEVWHEASLAAAGYARNLGEIGVHKSVANRLLEPFMSHTVVITATAWDNFFGLRCNPMAQPEIRVVAEAMLKVYNESVPETLTAGQWHLPYVQDDEKTELPTDQLVRISSARSARVSYLTQNGERDREEDLNLYARLTTATPMHASPLEHVCTPNAENVQTIAVRRRAMMDGIHRSGMELTLPVYGNFLGWHQHRFDVEILRGYRAFD